MDFKNYYQLTKPGIIYGNALTAAAGFFLASRGQISWGLFLAMLFGLSLVIASGCVFNNYFDRGIDKKMSRTKNRQMVKGVISPKKAVIYAIILGLIGTTILYLFTNLLTLLIAFLGFFFYVVVYTLWGKPHSIYGTILGSISGAVPPVVGYTAVTDNFDLAALLLFIILVAWQMPHFYAIAIYRLKDYAAAKIPVLPVKKGIFITKINMLLYILAFIISSLMLTVLGFTDYKYFMILALIGIAWLSFCLTGFKTKNDVIWARKMFIFSLVVIMLFFITITIDVTLA